MRNIWVVADDFGISPAVSGAIADLLSSRRLSGTGCMSLFPEWPEEACRLHEVPDDASIGLHITLTDQQALAVSSGLAPNGTLPTLRTLLAGITTGRFDDASIHAEIDAQYDAFRQAMGREPAYIDGHQHVHFLPPVRRWLTNLARTTAAPLPWLRGEPALPRLGSGSFAKVVTVSALARGFGSSMRSAGYTVRAPLSGFYDWRKPDGFGSMADETFARLPDEALFMCHPGRIDDILAARDPLTEAREAEFAFLSSDHFRALLERHQACVARA